MTVRITESRIPDEYLASDLGEATETPAPGGGKYVLVGFLTSPLRRGTFQEYVLFAVDAPADDYRWTVQSATGGITITTTIGSLSLPYDELGTHELSVEVREAGATVATLSLQQIVEPRDAALEARLGGDASQFAHIERELRNDLDVYIQAAAAATGAKGVPTGLMSAILYNEGGANGAKRDSANGQLRLKAGDYAAIREAQADRLADEYEANKPHPSPLPAGPLMVTPTRPATLGPGQVATWRIASLEDWIDWREADIAGSVWPAAIRRIVAMQDVSQFMALPFNRQIDMFNLARFPKSSVMFVGKLLAKMKNRGHRWPDTASADLLADLNAVAILGSEYRDGPTTTPAASARPNDNGNTIKKLISGEYSAYDRDLLP